MLPQHRKQVLLAPSDDSVITTLIHTRPHKALPRADFHNLRHLVDGIVADAEACEPSVSELGIHGSARLLKRRRPVRRVQIHDVDAFGTERRQRFAHAVVDRRGAVSAGLPGSHLGRDGGPRGNGQGAEKGFGGAWGANGVGSRAVDMGDTARAERIEDWIRRLGVVELGLRGAGPKRGGPEDDERVRWRRHAHYSRQTGSRYGGGGDEPGRLNGFRVRPEVH